MAFLGVHPPLKPGEPAPSFTLPIANGEGSVSLADYQGKRPLLLAFFRGLYCAFCRRHIAHLGDTRDKLLAAGVETLAITASPLERARLYLRYRPTRVSLATDPDRLAYEAFGLPRDEITPELLETLKGMYLQLGREEGVELPEAASPEEIMHAVGRRDGYEITEVDAADGMRSHRPGQFLIDREGIVRWVKIEGAEVGPGGLASFPGDEELLEAARAL
jgi:peroxiredoxin